MIQQPSPAAPNADELTPEAQRSLQALIDEGTSANTLAAHRSAAKYWSAWHERRYGEKFALPVTVATVLQFIIDHAGRTDPATGKFVCDLLK